MLDVEESPGCTAADGGSRSVSGATATVPALVEVATDMTEIGANTPPRVVECSCNVNAGFQLLVLIWLSLYFFFIFKYLHSYIITYTVIFFKCQT